MQLGDIAADDLTVPATIGAIEIAGLTADSRAVKPGFLFAALPGTKVDGARFAADAVGLGAVAVLAARDAVLDLPAGIAVLRADDPRRALARCAARFYTPQPARILAVTGTSGKTSVADFTRQILAAAGRPAASIGTIGVVTAEGRTGGSLTTPDTVALHEEMRRLASAGIDDVAIEASSHGLDQRRLDGLDLTAAAFTNLGRDHMDYHHDADDYFAAKMRLFEVLLPRGRTAVIDMDDARSEAVAAIARRRGQTIVGTGRKGREIRLAALQADGFGQRIEVDDSGILRRLNVPLAGAFQISNALVAVGLATAAGVPRDTAFAALETLTGAPGRLEFVGRKANGAMVFVDYAHKPEALTHALGALRAMTDGRLIVVFGAGGDRDHGKRPLMGAAASAAADTVIVTDDNPRSEDPATIRREIIAAAPDAIEIGDRGEAIARAVDMLAPGDVLCVAGKGHETGQIVGDRTLPFSDRDAVLAALAGAAA